MARRSRRSINQMNVVPYIDVMLVLLVIFMVAAPLINPGSIDLPSVGKALTQPEAPIEVDVHKDGKLTLVDRAQGGAETQLSRQDLVSWVRDKQKRRPDQPVVIAGDKDARYELILEVMDALEAAQVKHVGLLARSKGS